ncbi:hypothetical protein D9619_006545 [Psilocybe cf. subviscida]|uniref:NACHT domain-containing protein n=1 Tax=Psilocybe cf. subviscida TaxID=2480587 RepID=A0A8H5B417_9AGAR|nr:hypothetical protein D9619_006545 [Psilocybe cf. subviscida]
MASRKGSNQWTTIKPSLVLGLQAADMALDGLPIPGAKGCIRLILHFLETADVGSKSFFRWILTQYKLLDVQIAAGNGEALKALQRRLKSLQDVLLPVYAKKGVDVPDDVHKDVGDLAMNLDALAEQWKHKLEQKPKKRLVLHRLLNAKDDREVLSIFANAVDRAIQDFLVSVPVELPKTVQSTHTRATEGHHNYQWAGGANACMNGTRISILKTIREWARNPDPNQPPMFWLNGLAGIGKTTIAHTIASELDDNGLLGASFVFLRADDQLKDARLVFPTLAFQLAQFNSDFKTGLVEVLEHDPDCGSKRLDLQFVSLILRPFATAALPSPIVLILDALDECEPEELTSELLRILLKNIKSIPFLRVFITSRPEGYIREALDLVDSSSPHRKLVLHEDVHAEEVENDIRLFLQTRLQETWDEPTKRTSVRWPSEDDLEKLVKQSGRLFVYAATAVRFVGGRRAFNLDRQLATLLSVKIGHVPRGAPYRQLDGLYLQILGGVFTEDDDDYYIQRFRRIVGSIVLLEKPLPLGSLANLLHYSVEDVRETLYDLHSIIIVPTVDWEAPRTYHLSFPNFITNSDRCTNSKPYIDPGQQAKYLFDRCLAVMEQDFGPALVNSLDTEDIEGAPQDQNEELTPLEDEPLVDRDERPVGTHISVKDDSEDYSLAPEIRYSENYWCRHLMNIPTGNQEAASHLEQFTGRYLSKWLQRRERRISSLFGAPPLRFTVDTFDIIHDVYRWGASSQSGCSKQFQVFLRRSANGLYAQIFPNTDVDYVFGRRLNTVAIIEMRQRQESMQLQRALQRQYDQEQLDLSQHQE